MTVRIRVIPCLDVADGRVVKGVNFVDLKDAGDPVEQARAYDAAGADELCFLDISASHEGRGTLLDIVKRTAEVCFMPLTVGGGVRSVEDARALLLAGADKVAINSAAVARPGPFLTTVVTRLAVDHLRSARVRRETYVGPWLPEPLVDTAAEPAAEHELAESLSMAFLVLLEGLTPAERAAYVLHDVLGLSFPEVSGALERTPASCRQLASRARKHLRARRTRFPARPEDAERLAFAFFAAIRGGDLDALMAIFVKKHDEHSLDDILYLDWQALRQRNKEPIQDLPCSI